MSEREIERVIQVARHRNGVGGAPFYAVIFEADDDTGSGKTDRFVATVFDEAGAVAVLKIGPLAEGGHGVAFGANSWRGDVFEPELRQAIAAHDDGYCPSDKSEQREHDWKPAGERRTGARCSHCGARR